MAATITCVPPDAVGFPGVQSSWWSASAVFRDEGGRHELQIAVNELGAVTATVMGPDVDAFGLGTATLVPVTAHSVTCAATIVLTGYNVGGDGFRHLEAAIGATWTIDRAVPTEVEVAGTALLTDVDDDSLVVYRAVRRHPYNHLDLAALPTRMPTAPPADDRTVLKPAKCRDGDTGRRTSRLLRLIT